MFREVDIKVQSVSDTLGTRNTGQPLEERVQTQAISVDLREAVMACFSGGESRRWTVGGLVERFKTGRLRLTRQRDGGARRTGTRASTLELGAMAPARARNRMDPGAQIRALKASFRCQTAPSQRSQDPFRGA